MDETKRMATIGWLGLMVAALLLGVYVGVGAGMRIERWHDVAGVSVRCDTIVKRDTVVVERAAANDSAVIGYMRRCVRLVDLEDGCLNERMEVVWPLAYGGGCDPDGAAGAFCAGEDTTGMASYMAGSSDGGVGKSNGRADSRDPQSVTNDTEWMPVIIPVSQKRYAGDGYELWVSGYEPMLDSLRLYRCDTVIEREEIYLPKKRRRRWGCTAGIGVGAQIDGSIGPMVGVTIGYALW